MEQVIVIYDLLLIQIQFWRHLFDKVLKIDTNSHPILFVETPLTPRASREKLVQTFMEVFNTQYFLPMNSVSSLTRCFNFQFRCN